MRFVQYKENVNVLTLEYSVVCGHVMSRYLAVPDLQSVSTLVVILGHKPNMYHFYLISCVTNYSLGLIFYA